MTTFTCIRCKKPFELKIDGMKTKVGKYILSRIKPRYCFKCVEIEQGKRKELDDIQDLSDRITASRIGNYSRNIAKSVKTTFKWQTKALEFVISYSGDLKQKLPYLWGGVGTGKTRIAITLASKIMEEFKTQVFFSTASDFISSSIEDKTLFKKLKEAYCPIIIDDLGNHSISQWAIEKIYDILNYRLENTLPTLVTSNFNPIQLEKRLLQITKGTVDEIICKSISDRLLELCVPIKVDGESIRKIMFKQSIEKGYINENARNDRIKQAKT